MTDDIQTTLDEINAAPLTERLELIERMFQLGVSRDEDDGRYYVTDDMTLDAAFKTLRRMINNDGKV